MKKSKKAQMKALDENSRAVIYTRVSTDDQVTQGYGLDVQRERCKAQIAAKGWKYAGEYCDDGISGTLGEKHRPGLAAMMDAARNDQIDVVVFLSLDRLGREIRLVLTLVDNLKSVGVTIVSTKESLDTSTAQGMFVLQMFAALAELERNVIVERTTAGRDNRGKRDGEKGGRVPDGYSRNPTGGIVIVPTRVEIVRSIFQLRAKGLTLRAIAGELNGQGIKTQRGHVWHASSVKKILDNEAIYRGSNRGESDVKWEVILVA